MYNSKNVLNDGQSFNLSDYFFDASRLADPGFIDNAMRGLTKEVPNSINEHYTVELTDKLFRSTRFLKLLYSTKRKIIEFGFAYFIKIF